MSFGKADVPKPPDYTPIAQADAKVAQQQFELGQEQFDWGKNQFNQVWPYAQQYMTSQLAATNAEQAAAQDQQKFYGETYKPIETKFADQAGGYASPARTEERAASAMTDVSNSFSSARSAALSNLESYGIDPSTTRFGALDLSTRVSEAAAKAAAGTQSRLNTEATGLALEGEAINTGRGYPSSIAQAYSTATNAGSTGIGGANSTTATGVNSMGGPQGYFSGGSTALSGVTTALGTGFDNRLGAAKLDYQAKADTMKGIGQLIGGGLGAAMRFA